MNLLTFQPLHVLEKLNNGEEYIPPKNKVLGRNIFCIKYDENAMRNLFMCAPSMPQVKLVLSIPDEDITARDYITWVNHINNLPTTDLTETYTEYSVKVLKPEWLLKSEVITTSNDADEVQGTFMNTHFEDLEKLSGFHWYRAGDTEVQYLWKSNEGLLFVRKVTRYMIPEIVPLTNSDVKEAFNLIEKYFKSKKRKEMNR